MRNYVEFETAILLKEAGFSQPKPEYGQVWYFIESGRPILIGNPDDFRSHKDKVFAPSLADILEQLGSSAYTYYESGEPEGYNVSWYCVLNGHGPFSDKHPSECAARAFLDKKKSA